MKLKTALGTLVLSASIALTLLPARAYAGSTTLMFIPYDETFRQPGGEDYIPRLTKYLKSIPGNKSVQVKLEDSEGLLKKAVKGVRFARVKINDSKEILILPTFADPSEAVLVEGLFIGKYHPEAVILASSCGLLNDKFRLLDIVVPSDYYRFDYRYLGPENQESFYPDWSDAVLKIMFASRYHYHRDPGAIEGRIKKYGESAEWKKVAASILKDTDTHMEGAPTPRIHLGTANITGSQFIASAAAREKYQAYFKADTVDMRAQQLASSAARLGVDAVSVLSCGDNAGVDRADNAMGTLLKNIDAALLLTSVLSIQSVGP